MAIETYGVLNELQNNEIEDSNESTLKKLFNEYEQVIVKSLITSFGMDFLLIKDRHGGDVDTIHNVRQMQKGDNRFDGYANKKNEDTYSKNETYDKHISHDYHSDSRYIERNRQASVQKDNGTLVDAYTGKKIAQNEKVDLDHVISAKEIHEDAGRILAEINGVELANQNTNLQHTNRSANRSKGKKTVNQFADTLENNRQVRQNRIAELKTTKHLTDIERKELRKLENLEAVDIKKMKKADEVARAAYEKEIASKYYTSQKFINDTLKASYKKGMQMGLRQALGTILTAVWMSVREEVPKLVTKLKVKFDLKCFFNGLVDIFKGAFKKVQEAYKEVIQSYSNGLLSGILSSLMTTFINIFTTSAKNVGKIIRECWSSIVEALNILLFNPNKLPFGDVIKAVAVIICTASSVVLGTVVSEAMGQIPALKIPIIGDVLPNFVGAVVTGLMSISLLYFLDHSSMVQKFVDWANQLKSSIDYKIDYYREVHAELVKYAAKLAEIDLDTFQNKVHAVQKMSVSLQMANTTQEMNVTLTSIVKEFKIDLPYDGTVEGLNQFIKNKNSTLTFKL
ncbi:hypothetical protein FCT18_17410 [Lysinibacillus sphaericus]|uniref:Domain of uncharacterized function (DUF1994) n=1 Tax=Lysinibacillus sphaericus TaxID=1421 RepID=A0A2S0JWY6_LYSSH|nr:hypothetical protein [Lysinibacillus sphaericus]AVK95652.1 hypothetical protein LS41612_04880 [Lysinibacillus sphaericus]MED4545627.1 hypothetical protein [Lysinibacillus sphaericus]TKI17579.1 hypothetical protein FCT18_17410 [Lysinibacillus sphaericus]SUV18619.1 Domain of uncharacterised function (DUF1994) [Lysinibacillus sphaericus]GEC82797.1 hypothetical protein LSP03_25400 [Lysinibacillus sphaericus]